MTFKDNYEKKGKSLNKSLESYLLIVIHAPKQTNSPKHIIGLS